MIYCKQFVKLLNQIPHFPNAISQKSAFAVKYWKRVEEIPPYMWVSRVLQRVPLNPNYRKSICQEILCWRYQEFFQNKNFLSPYLYKNLYLTPNNAYDHNCDNMVAKT